MKRESLTFAAIVMPFLALTVYVGGYFALTEASTIYNMENSSRVRWFDSEMTEVFYRPAVKMESLVLGWPVSVRQTSSRPKGSH